MKNFSLKFIDIMVGIILGLGFQWWPELHEPWQYIAFVFVYLDITDYWIDYSLSLKKFPPKREIDVFLDLGIMFALFLYIYSTQLSISYFLFVFMIFKALDYFWLLSSKNEYHPIGTDKLFVNTWLQFNFIEVLVTALLIIGGIFVALDSLALILIFIGFRIVARIVASFKYKKVHFI